MASFALPHRRVRGGTRRGARLARGLETLVRDARRPPPFLTAAAPFRTDAVCAAAPELLELAAALRTSTDPNPHGLELANRLLTDPAGPVYSDCGEDLRVVASAISLALQAHAR